VPRRRGAEEWLEPDDGRPSCPVLRGRRRSNALLLPDQIHGVNERGKTVLRKQLKRAQVTSFFVNLPACLNGMEACGSAHFWARQLTHGEGDGATVVKPYVKTNKNDVADAEAICEAVARPNMRFVPIKNAEQQALLALHRARQGFIVERTAQGNQLRGLLAEFGIAIPLDFKALTAMMPQILEAHENGLPGLSRELFSRLFSHFRELDRQVKELDEQIQAWHREDAVSQRLQRIPGVGPLTASALVASVSDAKTFRNGRQFAAWLGLVPRQNSGGKERLLGISKRGDTYLRTLLIHGARAVVRHLKPSLGELQSWVARVADRRNPNIAAVALANKNARIVWALLAHDRYYQSGYVSTRPVAAA
jgi:transposase